MLLEKLVEKKDILAYIKFRINMLVKTIKEVPQKEPPENRQPVIDRLEGRITELKMIRRAIADDDIRNKSKMYYEMSEAWKDG